MQLMLVSVGQERDITLWDIRAPDAVGCVPGAHAGPISSVAMSPASSTCATGGADGTVHLWDLRCPMDTTGHAAPLAAGAAHTGAIRGLAFHPTMSDCLLSAGMDGCVGTWQL
jgi:WD40 repeat protein